MQLALTNIGRRKAKDVQGKGVDQSILATLEENGPASVEELSKDLNVNVNVVKDNAAKLANQGFIRKEE